METAKEILKWADSVQMRGSYARVVNGVLDRIFEATDIATAERLALAMHVLEETEKRDAKGPEHGAEALARLNDAIAGRAACEAECSKLRCELADAEKRARRYLEEWDSSQITERMLSARIEDLEVALSDARDETEQADVALAASRDAFDALLRSQGRKAEVEARCRELAEARSEEGKWLETVGTYETWVEELQEQHAALMGHLEALATRWENSKDSLGHPTIQPMRYCAEALRAILQPAAEETALDILARIEAVADYIGDDKDQLTEDLTRLRAMLEKADK